MHRAQTIRLYVEAVLGHPGMERSSADLARWVAWACAEADRLDPVLNGAAVRSLSPPKLNSTQDVEPRETDAG